MQAPRAGPRGHRRDSGDRHQARSRRLQRLVSSENRQWEVLVMPRIIRSARITKARADPVARGALQSERGGVGKSDCGRFDRRTNGPCLCGSKCVARAHRRTRCAEERTVTEKKKSLWTNTEIEEHLRPFTQRLNPNSYFLSAPLSRLAGMKRAHVAIARLPAGKDSFAYHAHMIEEEWLYVLSGRAI